jgi:putative ABC transport system permease protein
MALPSPGNYPHPDMHMVSPGFVETLGIPLLRGRTFAGADIATTPRVALVNATLAKQFFPNEDPIGKRFMFGHPSAKREPNWFTIVGVVSDTKLYGLANPARLEVYTSSLQGPSTHMTLLVRSKSDPASLLSSIRSAVASVDKDQPIFAITTMNQVVSSSISTRRITLILLGLFSGLALILAGIGIYGVIAYSVAQRTREIGIRIALGARRSDVLGMILKQGAKIALLGIAIGLVAAFGLMRLMASLLFSVSAFDPITFISIALMLAIVALAACYVPARRAMKVDPMLALRYE